MPFVAAGCRFHIVAVSLTVLTQQQQGHQGALRLSLLSAAEGMPPLGCILLMHREVAEPPMAITNTPTAPSAPSNVRRPPPVLLAMPGPSAPAAVHPAGSGGSGSASRELLPLRSLEAIVFEAVREAMGGSGVPAVDADTPLMTAGERL
jgi:hypothetical protein